ncbi:MAG: phosphopentomutase [Epulopiscium sp. Nele67-Bin001]|nr:MAG: phosphopentomutase [Epulopiscium sp. Nele67-Bin001]
MFIIMRGGRFMKKVIWIVLDSVGIGALPDAADYGDGDVNTLGNVYSANHGLRLPTLRKLGLFNIDGVSVDEKFDNPIGSYGRLNELSKGKDTTTGHWEMVGIHTEVPFPTYPYGFPEEIIREFEARTGHCVIGNIPASGTQIIEELGEQHMCTKNLIVYTSADSVFQIAAHEKIIPIDDLYKYCEIAREIMRGEHEVSRVIARPFEGDVGKFTRTANRHDYAVAPTEENLLCYAKNADIPVIGIGKIEDIFAGSGISAAVHTKGNDEGMDLTIKYTKELDSGIIFTNLVDFDMKWGHRNDPIGYGRGLEVVDGQIGKLLEVMDKDDILFITADHGCDPTAQGTDHTREYVPLLIYSPAFTGGVNLGTRNSFADIGQTVSEIFGLRKLAIGKSFLNELN